MPSPSTTGLPPEHLRRYRAARAKIDPEIRFIHSLTALPAKFEEFDRDRVSMTARDGGNADFAGAENRWDPVALGIVHGTLEQSVLAIWRELDDFLLASTAERGSAGDTDD